MAVLRTILFLTLCCTLCFGRLHKLHITNDERKYIALSTFGFYKGGLIDVQLKKFKANPEDDLSVFGFSLDRTVNDAVNLHSQPDSCILTSPITPAKDEAITYFILNLKTKKLTIKCKGQEFVHIYKNLDEVPTLVSGHRQKRQDVDICDHLNFDITSQVINGKTYYNASFIVSVASAAEEGLYNLYFHSCPNPQLEREVSVDFTIEIIESNMSSYLSASEMPLPTLYSMMAILFLLSGMYWVFLLHKSKYPVSKIHYMMTVLVFLKTMSLAFHAMDYHYIERLGVRLPTWTILFYVAHLLKGVLLVTVLILLGTGWTFIKHVLAPRDKILLMIVILLQILSNIAEIILNESEKSDQQHVLWRNTFILADLLSCVGILVPPIWSIRHLRKASHGKTNMNLRKLKLFRYFYVLIVFYIYTTRVVVYLMKITVPFQYGWLDRMVIEIAIYVFFVLTAYKFRPADGYFQSGAIEGSSMPQQSTLIEVTEEEKDALLSEAESN